MGSIIDGPLTSVAFCWRLERSDGAGLALTSGDRDIAAPDILYRSAPGVTPGLISRSLGLEPDSGEVAGALAADSLSQDDLAQGRWNGASVRLATLDWTAPGSDALALLGGELGEVSIDGDGFSAELRGAASRMLKAPCPSTSPECRAAFGDKKCRVDLAGRTFRPRVVSASDNVLKLDQPVDSKFLFGRLRYLSGDNCGLVTAILGISGTEVSLRDRPRAPVVAGTVVELREGCDKRFETCVSRFGNAVNFRGEPHLPGTDLLTRYPGA
jgi:uncharacterized phage protein (TIGR02218 family)